MLIITGPVGLLLLGASGFGAVVALGTLVVALGTRRPADPAAEQQPR